MMSKNVFILNMAMDSQNGKIFKFFYSPGFVQLKISKNKLFMIFAIYCYCYLIQLLTSKNVFILNLVMNS